jgi:hypothetical protein
MAGRNSRIALSNGLAVIDEGGVPEEACLILGKKEHLLTIIPVV